jgi:hypothetical protein
MVDKWPVSVWRIMLSNEKIIEAMGWKYDHMFWMHGVCGGLMRYVRGRSFPT